MFIRQVFHLPLRQTEGFMNSLNRIMKATISIPDYSSISKRSISIPMHVLSQAMEPGSLVIVDSTGLRGLAGIHEYLKLQIFANPDHTSQTP